MSAKEMIKSWQTAQRQERGAIVEALIDNRGESLPVLRKTIQNGSRAEKEFACRFLAEMRDRESVPALSSLAETGDSQIACATLNALRKIRDPAACPTIRKVLSADASSDDVRVCALVSLGHIGSSES